MNETLIIATFLVNEIIMIVSYNIGMCRYQSNQVIKWSFSTRDKLGTGPLEKLSSPRK